MVKPWLMVTTATTVTSTMQIVECHVKYNTTTDHNPAEADTVVVGVRLNKKKVITIVTSTT